MAQSCQSCGGRNRTCVGAINNRLPVPARDPPQSVRTAGFEPAISRARGTRNARLSHILNNERPAGIEPALPPWQGSRLPVHHGRLCVTTKLSMNGSTGPDSNRRTRITGAESWPLDDQCLSVGPEGLEPSPARLRAGNAATNTLVLCLQLARRELNPRPAPYKDAADPARGLSPRAVCPPLSYAPARVGPEGIEPTPSGLKVRHAACYTTTLTAEAYTFQAMRHWCVPFCLDQW
jgi:hypothetical protein